MLSFCVPAWVGSSKRCRKELLEAHVLEPHAPRPLPRKRPRISWGAATATTCLALAGRSKRCGRASKSKVEEPSHEDYDTLLMKAGLRNLLGVEENRMARKLEEACEVSTDLKRCLSDVEVGP